MATGKPGLGRRILWSGAAAIAVLVIVVLTVVLPPLRSKAEAGAAYGARIGCSCRFVAGRPLGQCSGDFEHGMALVSLSEDPAAKSVTARVPLLASDTARFVPGAGCRLDPWTR